MQPPRTGARSLTAASARPPRPSAPQIYALARGDGGCVEHGSRPLARWLSHCARALATLRCHVPRSVGG
eukprot:5247003-Pleurochrysis_carterae.AAC.4